MKVLVTGGAGFIGSHVVDKLVLKGAQVTVLDNLSTGTIKNVNKKASFIEMDIRSSAVAEIFKAERFDFVIHQAAQTVVASSLSNPHFDCDVNIQGTVNILEACRKYNVRRIVFASSAAVYGNVVEIPIKIGASTHPASFYGLSKLMAEKYITLYSQIYGLEFMVLRYANVYGERQGDTGEGGVVSIFLRKTKEAKPVTVFGDGQQTRDFIYVGDVADANIRALYCFKSNSIHNVSTCTEISVNSLIDTIERVTGTRIERVYTEPRKGDIFRSCLDNKSTQSDLDWHPITKLEDGLKRTCTYLLPSQVVGKAV